MRLTAARRNHGPASAPPPPSSARHRRPECKPHRFGPAGRTEDFKAKVRTAQAARHGSQPEHGAACAELSPFAGPHLTAGRGSTRRAQTRAGGASGAAAPRARGTTPPLPLVEATRLQTTHMQDVPRAPPPSPSPTGGPATTPLLRAGTAGFRLAPAGRHGPGCRVSVPPPAPHNAPMDGLKKKERKAGEGGAGRAAAARAEAAAGLPPGPAPRREGGGPVSGGPRGRRWGGRPGPCPTWSPSRRAPARPSQTPRCRNRASGLRADAAAAARPARKGVRRLDMDVGTLSLAEEHCLSQCAPRTPHPLPPPPLHTQMHRQPLP